MAVIKLTKANFETEALKSTKPVLVDFYADWCGPCKMVSPLVDELAEESDSYKVGKINVDESPELAAKYGVMSIPTLIVFKDGKVAQQAIGARGKDAIRRMLA
ncbi:MAG: thioredoxin [Eubacteriales bacterium]|nr:thioredoxin [Eubacteriales bacterium]